MKTYSLEPLEFTLFPKAFLSFRLCKKCKKKVNTTAVQIIQSRDAVHPTFLQKEVLYWLFEACTFRFAMRRCQFLGQLTQYLIESQHLKWNINDKVQQHLSRLRARTTCLDSDRRLKQACRSLQYLSLGLWSAGN